VGDAEILETYLNSASKNTSETDTFPHGTKSLLTSVIYLLTLSTIKSVKQKSNIIVRDSTFDSNKIYSREQRLQKGLYVCLQHYTKHRWIQSHSKTFNECITV
jgi:hypothetical protein